MLKKASRLVGEQANHAIKAFVANPIVLIAETGVEFNEVVATKNLECFVVDLAACEEERGDFLGVIVESEATIGVATVDEALGSVHVMVVDPISQFSWEGEEIEDASPFVDDLCLGDFVGRMIGTYFEGLLLV